METTRVICYGFGWVGQSMLAFCEAAGFECVVVDDGLDLELMRDERFKTFDVFKEEFAFCLISVVDDLVAEHILDKLRQNAIPFEKIRRTKSYDFRSSMAYAIGDFFGNSSEILQSWRADSFELPLFHQKIKELVTAHRLKKKTDVKDLLQYRKTIDSKFDTQTVFAKMYRCVPLKGVLAHIPYPGFNVHVTDKDCDENFFFEPIDWDSVINRPKTTKLIACFGNSALRLHYIPQQQRLTGFLRKRFAEVLQKECMVLNFGVSGYTVYEQLMLFNALGYNLKPDLVLSFFGGTDWRTGIASDEILVERHKMTYTPGYYEYAFKKFYPNTVPLYTELQAANPHIDDSSVNAAIVTRLEQFYNTVVGGGGGAICCFYPATFASKETMERCRTGYAAQRADKQ